MLDISNIKIIPNDHLVAFLAIVENTEGNGHLFDAVKDELERRMADALTRQEEAKKALAAAAADEAELGRAFDRSQCLGAMRDMVDDEFGLDPENAMTMILNAAVHSNNPDDCCDILRGWMLERGAVPVDETAEG